MNVAQARAGSLLEHLRIDPTSDALLDALVGGLTSDQVERLSLVAFGDGADVGSWEAITNPTKAPLWALPHSALYTGGILPPRMLGESDEDYLVRARAAVVQPRGPLRGSLAAARIAAWPHLTGTKTVRVDERHDDDDWEYAVLVLEAEVVDLDALTAAVNDPAVITAGMRAVVEYLPADLAWTVAELEDTYYGRTLADMEADFATVADLESHSPEG
jgi:hypothetical protein